MRGRFAACGVDPAKFESLEQLADYPLLTKQDLILHRERMVNPEFDAKQRLYITTGGSSGVPVGFYLHKGVSRPKEQAYLEAQWSRRGYRPGDRVAVMRGGVTSDKARGGISSYDATRNWLILSSYHLTPERLPEYVAALNKFRPRHLHAYPSAALMLARGLEQAGLKLEFDLTSVLCGSEKLTRESQQYLEQAFAAPVFHWYGHSERVVLAGAGAHLEPSLFLADLWLRRVRRTGCGRSSRGHRHLVPQPGHAPHPLSHGRLREARAPQDADSRECAMARGQEVAGRDYEFLVSATGRRISLTAINMHDGIFEGLMAVQFYQDRKGEAEFRYQPGPQWHSSRVEPMRAGLARKLGDDFTLVLREVKEVEKTKAGKHRWLISKLPKDEPQRAQRNTED